MKTTYAVAALVASSSALRINTKWAEGIEDVEKESLSNRGDDDSAARTVAIRRALEERNERRRMAEDLDYLDFDD